MISIIICTHNPRAHFLEAVLNALKAQSLGPGEWELILVDNLSTPPLSGQFDLSWHAQGRILVEENLGLTYARWAGFGASRGELIIYVDDDNVLAPDYLEEAFRISMDCPFLGAWGGQILMEFDNPLTPEQEPYTRWQLHHEVPQARWANFFQTYADFPSGAGLCVRRKVLDAYVAKLARDPLRQKLDRTGAMAGGCGGDTDIVATCLEIGLGMGEFPSLVLRHLTPDSRLTRTYCLKQSYSLGYSVVVLNRVLNRPQGADHPPLLTRLRESYQYWKEPPLVRAAQREKEQGRKDALKMLQDFDAGKEAVPSPS